MRQNNKITSVSFFHSDRSGGIPCCLSKQLIGEGSLHVGRDEKKDGRDEKKDGRDEKKFKGFTLVELTVSLTITAIIMVGLSVFFANSFHNVFQTQEQLTQTQGQFVLNEIIRDKLADLDELKEQGTNEILFKNKITKDRINKKNYFHMN